jgi:hypothetical protein
VPQDSTSPATSTTAPVPVTTSWDTSNTNAAVLSHVKLCAARNQNEGNPLVLGTKSDYWSALTNPKISTSPFGSQ